VRGELGIRRRVRKSTAYFIRRSYRHGTLTQLQSSARGKLVLPAQLSIDADDDDRPPAKTLPCRLCRRPHLRRVVIYSSPFSANLHVCQSPPVVCSPALHICLPERRKWRRKEQVISPASLTRGFHITDFCPPSVVIKVGMVGDSQIGKTSLMVKYVEGSFDEDYIQTLGKYSS
jgi:hypothetical protein